MPAPPPDHLSERAKEFWASVVAFYVLDDPAAIELLRRACEASDRADQARAEVDRDGVTVVTRHGEVRVHPAVAVERDSRNALKLILRELRVTDVPGDDRVGSKNGGRR